MIRPPRLRDGARIALVAPAGPIAADRLEAALERCARYGLEAVPGRAVGHRHGGYLAGSDAERLADLQSALSDPDIDAVWALRGGYGTMRLLRQLDLANVARAPRAYIGFSDNTAVHLALHACGVVSFHGPHAGGETTSLTERCLHEVLWQPAAAGVLGQPGDRPAFGLHGGRVDAPLLGGNLSLLAALCGTPAAPRAAGHILFVEEVGEPLYRIDRAWTQLLLSGALDDVAGIAFGHFTDCEDGGAVADVLHRLTAPLGVPVLAGLPFGHEPDNWTLPLGVRARMDADGCTFELLEPAVS